MGRHHILDPELLEVTFRERPCTYTLPKKGMPPHSCRLWEVRTVPDGILRARIPECVFLRFHKRQIAGKRSFKLTPPEEAILSEMHRMHII